MSSMGPLDLSDANIKGFEAVDAGRYNAKVFALDMDAVKNTSGRGKMPAGTPMIKVQFKLTADNIDPSVENKRVFVSYVIPPEGYDQKKAATMKGMIARFFMALGVPEEQVMSNAFDADFQAFIDSDCVVVVGKEPKRTSDGVVIDGEYNNPVKGVKPAGSIGSPGENGESSPGLL